MRGRGRSGKRTSDNFVILRTLMQKTIEGGDEVFLAFINLKSAFDTIDRREIRRVLEEMKAPSKLYNSN